MKVKKRNGSIVSFDKKYIRRAISLAAAAVGEQDEEMEEKISDVIEQKLKERREEIIGIETIQDMVEECLFEQQRFRTAKAYILYRKEKEQHREEGKYRLLSREFLSSYKHTPNPMEQLGAFVYSRTYSRYLPQYGRREFWWETVRRAVEYNCSLAPTSREEAEQLYDNIYNLRQFLSGRTLWVGNTKVADAYPMANYNCAFEVIDSYHAFHDLFYLLMIGSGVGVRVLKEDAMKLPKIRTDMKILHKAYSPREVQDRLEYTNLDFSNDTVTMAIGDSKEGWAQALEHYFQFLTNREYSKIRTVIVEYDSIRPRGERLHVFGGTASGYESMMAMLDKIHRVITTAGMRSGKKYMKLAPIDLLDIANIIGENVVSGGVRRTSEICLIDQDDEECIQAKSSLYRQVDGHWEIDKSIAHRQMSNNSIYYRKKPTREQLHWHLQQMRYSGEPGWINEEAGLKRRSNFKGCNPCGEILLDSHGMCNLTTVNVMAFVKDGVLDTEGLLKAQRLSVRAGYRMTCRELEIHEWDYVQQRDRLLGCSLTGWQDMVNATGMNREEQSSLLDKLRETAHEAAGKIARQLGQKEPLLVTTVKPEGTLSLLPTVSSGIHYSHSQYYVRRVRITATDPLCKVCEELGYPVFPEVGQDEETCRTKVVEFPVKAPEGRVKADVSAIEQLENYKMFMTHYVDHNCSITVHVRDDEWDDVEEWVWINWDDIVALSFLSYDDSFYELLPYEAISEEEYLKRKDAMKPFNPSLISKYEQEESELDIGVSDCANGVCPIR
ncbi:MAG TPA: ribonucleoside-triphosphate reductase, adenosylcobalamin-dependent [Candidatus Lachnoclostridium avicola]|uniref:Adenosylcobalamin-dependent ribonucleoside-triphosphate reductase n=1 Tax=Candidatus Limivivens merdigallinarum TaxID=2840859 RepID=A0A9D1D2M4_9FIRM|nr:ribonucleoside-triphosphate reductase, adenosylcobalamin-dependent [Candidatus Limivivens merdigallinarum]HIX24325.1 ribonucleoside-triphosphate reductase, adenosylcobalamin-dependent [Candidatus Lachnoclostridium avicola]